MINIIIMVAIIDYLIFFDNHMVVKDNDTSEQLGYRFKSYFVAFLLTNVFDFFESNIFDFNIIRS